MDNIFVLKFADSKVPEFKEVRNKDWVLYGEDNDYPQYLLNLYNKSAKHNAIINGKVAFEFAGGAKPKTTSPELEAWMKSVNTNGETLNDILEKSIRDVEIFGGFAWQVIRGKFDATKLYIHHIDFSKIRVGKDGNSYFYKKNWKDTRESPIPYEAFSNKPDQLTSIFYYKEYRPGIEIYPLPSYIGCNNYIETDIEISKFHLSAIRNGMMPSKMVEMFIGESVTTEKKKEVEKAWGDKFSGSENAGRFIFVSSTDPNKSVKVTDLSSSDLDKQFDILNKTVQQEIFTGHSVTSPSLFGVMEAGKLGDSQERREGYEIFINTYAKPKQQRIEQVLNYWSGILGFKTEWEFEPLDPLGFNISADKMAEVLPKTFLYQKLNVPEEFWNDAPAISNGNDTPIAQDDQALAVNPHMKNLTGRQQQQILRIIRQYDNGNGKLKLEQAKLMLKSGFGLNDEEINVMLGSGQQFSSVYSDDDVVDMFSLIGEPKDYYFVTSSKKILFNSESEAAEDENNFYKAAFASLSVSDAKILDLIKKDPKITPQVIAKALNVRTEWVEAKIATLTGKGIIQGSEVASGEDTVIERQIVKEVATPDTVEIFIKYSYEGARDSRNRPFCAKMMELNRFYSRAEIEQISARLGYSVFDRRGGFWMHKDGKVTPYCRHHWKSNVVVKK
jgi:DNA-binding Lrp family transcriptional regulator